MGTRDQGFTLLECLLALGIGSLTIGVAVPTYMNVVATADVADLQTTLIEGLTASMRHSIVTSTSVVMCPSQDGQQCTGGGWSRGWIAYADIDGNRVRGPQEPLIHVRRRLDPNLRISGSEARTKLVFKANGGNPGSNTTFTLCDVAGRAKALSVMLANNGRIRRSAATAEAKQACRAA